MCYKIGVFSLANKCGKTTTAAFLAESFATLGHNTILIDNNPINTLRKRIVFKDKIETGLSKVKLLHSPSSWTYLYDKPDYEDFDELIEKYKFDYAILDLSVDENQDAFEMLDTVIIPTEAEYYGLEKLQENLRQVKNYKELKVKILITKFGENSKSSLKVKNYIIDNLSPLVYNTIISRSYYLGLSSFTVENLNKTIPNFGFADYLKLANEIKEKEQNG